VADLTDGAHVGALRYQATLDIAIGAAAKWACAAARKWENTHVDDL
jgi:hypothetical protein